MADFAQGLLSNSLIVAAHPDDELLWFGSILKNVDRVLLVYEDYWPDPVIGPARAAALARFPRGNVDSLRLPEAATTGCANWPKPQLSDWGIELGLQCEIRDAKQAMKRLFGRSKAPRSGIRRTYEANYKELVGRLRPQLDSTMNIFTHNPWGEYGHEDHIQVFRALDQLRREIGFKLWMSNYCTERALPLAMSYFETHKPNYIQLEVDVKFADIVANVYRQTDCWTWADDWSWFETECFMEAPTNQTSLTSQGHLFPLNMFNIDPVA